MRPGGWETGLRGPGVDPSKSEKSLSGLEVSYGHELQTFEKHK